MPGVFVYMPFQGFCVGSFRLGTSLAYAYDGGLDLASLVLTHKRGKK